MRNSFIKLAALSTLGFASAPVFATGFLSLPATGLTVAASANQPAGTTAYVRCNTTGNYGSLSYTAPTTGANNTCAVFPGSINTAPRQTDGTTFSPVSGSSYTNTITANGETLANMDQRVFRNSGATECIYGKRIRMSTSATFDYNPQLAGRQFLEVNDVALGGFSGTTNVSAGYYHTTVTDSPVFRMGRTFTSVQMQPELDVNGFPTSNPASGFVHRPLTTPAPASGTEINGVGQTASPSTVAPTAAQQTAAIRTNWVDFTLDTTDGVDGYGTTSTETSMMYVRAACNSSVSASLANSVRIRQTGHETQPWVTILTSGQTVSTANANF